MVYIYCLIFFLYAVTLLVMNQRWKKTFSDINSRNSEMPEYKAFVSVIIPMRNEAENILALLRDLQQQTYKQFEIIVVDDHSDDVGPALVRAYLQRSRNGVLITNSGLGKKAALAAGVASAGGSIILCTDGDCRVGMSWIANAVKTFANDKIQFAFGVVRLQGEQIFQQMQAIEFASVTGTGIAAHGLGHMLYCNGANLAFRKTAFDAVGGYEGNLHIASGDDEFLMRKIDSRYGNAVGIYAGHDAMVTSQALSSVSDFFNQRLRWAGKWRWAPGHVRATALVTVLLHLLFLSSWIFVSLDIARQFFLSLLLIKLLAEWSFLYTVCRDTQTRFSFFAFLALQAVYSFYVVGVGVLCNFLSYRWKERTLPAAVRPV